MKKYILAGHFNCTSIKYMEKVLDFVYEEFSEPSKGHLPHLEKIIDTLTGTKYMLK